MRHLVNQIKMSLFEKYYFLGQTGSQKGPVFLLIFYKYCCSNAFNMANKDKNACLQIQIIRT